jgi:type II secretory pathway component PulF
LEGGDAISETMRATNAFTPLTLDMMQTGETTGNLDSMLTKVAEYYEDEAEVKAQQLGKILGVVAIVIVAVYVLIVLIKFYTELFAGYVETAGAEE